VLSPQEGHSKTSRFGWFRQRAYLINGEEYPRRTMQT